MYIPKTSVFDNPDIRKACLYEFLKNKFLKNKFGKEVEDITREELLSLGWRDFRNPKIRKTSAGSALSLYMWASDSKDINGQNIIFYLLKDTSLVDKHKLAESDFKDSAKQKNIVSHEVFSSSSNRKTCLYEFIKKKFGKEVEDITKEEFTKEELLLLNKKDFYNAKINKTSVGSASSLYSWAQLAKDRNGLNIIFYLLKDADLLNKHNLSEENFKGFDSPSVRQTCIHEFLKNKFGKEVENITKEELLSLRQSDFFNLQINKTSVGSALSLYSRAVESKDRKGQNIVFYLLKDAGIADSHSIKETDITHAAYFKVGRNRQILFIENKLLPHNENSKTIDVSLLLVQKDLTTQIQSIFSTSKAENSGINVQSSSAREQVLANYFSGVSNIPAKSACQKLKDAVAGESMVLTSSDPLDGIYLNGLSLMGFETIQQNLFHPQAKGCYFTSVIRKEIKADAVPLMFDNDLQPLKASMHILGQYGRLVSTAQSEVELYHAVGLGLEWLIKITESGVIPQNQVEYVKIQGLDKLVHAEARAMARLGLEPRYTSDIRERYNEVAKKLAPIQIKGKLKVEQAIRRETLGKKQI